MATSRDPQAASFVFIIGTGRCGSTLIHEVLAQHPGVGFLSNVEDRISAPPIAGRWNGPIYRRLPPSITAKGRIRFAPSEGYRILARNVSPAICTPVRDLIADDATPWLAGRFREFFERRARAQRMPVFLHKFTGWPRARFIDAVFPGSRFIHVIRDGRAVAASLVRMPWWQGYRGPDAWGWGPLSDDDRRVWEASGRSFPVLAGIEWKLLMQAADGSREAVAPDRWRDIRYEDFVADPVSAIKDLLPFVGLDWTSRFEERLSLYRIHAERLHSFRRDLSSADVAAIERAVGGELSDWGYPVGGRDPT